MDRWLTGLALGLFWGGSALLVYTYVGYGLVVLALLRVRRWRRAGGEANSRHPEPGPEPDLPGVTLLVAAYNEREWVEEKVRNARSLAYPQEKLSLLFVTDGSTDGTPDLLRRLAGVAVLHQAERAGKAHAVNRAMPLVRTPIVVLSDANAMFNPEAIAELVKHFQDPAVGCVAGEKRIRPAGQAEGRGVGEGLYWRYESFLKRQDAELHSVVGAAGEILALRTGLYEPVEPDTVIEDFVLSLRLAERGYRTAYAPGAYALEAPSLSPQDDLTRRIRICAGGFQAMARLTGLLNPRKHGLLTFQYVSHRVLRWTLAPLALALLLPSALFLALRLGGVYPWLFWGQVALYGAAAVGWALENRGIRLRPLALPTYFVLMNLAAFLGFWRYVRGRQPVVWEKARRSR